MSRFKNHIKRHYTLILLIPHAVSHLITLATTIVIVSFHYQLTGFLGKILYRYIVFYSNMFLALYMFYNFEWN